MYILRNIQTEQLYYFPQSSAHLPNPYTYMTPLLSGL